MAACFGYQDRLALTHGQRPYHKYFDITANHYDLVLVDGRDRVQCLQRVIDECGRLPGDRQGGGGGDRVLCLEHVIEEHEYLPVNNNPF